jgi:hypothetical protein
MGWEVKGGYGQKVCLYLCWRGYERRKSTPHERRDVCEQSSSRVSGTKAVSSSQVQAAMHEAGWSLMRCSVGLAAEKEGSVVRGVCGLD